MMIPFHFLLLTGSAISSYCAIDLGSQYLKVSTMDIDGFIKIVPNSHNKMMTPASVALKLDKYPNHHLTNIEALNAQLKVGDDALRHLKIRPESGSYCIPRLLGRSISSATDFSYPSIVDASEMLSFLIKNLFPLNKFPTTPSLIIAVPAYYTYEQRNDVINALYSSSMNCIGLIDDNQAISTLYSIRFSKRFSEQNQQILFVDCGSTSMKAYRCLFSMNYTTNPPTPLINITSYEWTEDCGGELFARKYSRHYNISISKARKMLISLTNTSNKDINSTDFFSEELSALSRLIKRAVNGPIDQIQLIGGSSRLFFVKDIISQAANGVEIKKELPPFDSIAIGAMHVLQEIENISIYQFPNITRTSPYNSYVECGNVTDDYCYQSANCTFASILENTKCDILEFKTDIDDVPKGTTPILGRYDMANISQFPEGRSGGFVMFKEPMPVLVSALWCRNEDLYCQNIMVRPTLSNELVRNRQKAFVETVLNAQKEIEKLRLIKIQISDLIQNIENFLDESNDVQVDEMKIGTLETIEYAKKMCSKSNNYAKLQVIKNDLEIIAHYVGISVHQI